MSANFAPTSKGSSIWASVTTITFPIHQSAEAKGERIVAVELKRLKWKEAALKEKPKTHPEKLEEPQQQALFGR